MSLENTTYDVMVMIRQGVMVMIRQGVMVMISVFPIHLKLPFGSTFHPL